MTTPAIERISEGLLAHLHLTAKQAAVVVDDRATPAALVVYIYDKQASGRVGTVTEWRGHPVKLVKNVSVSVH